MNIKMSFDDRFNYRLGELKDKYGDTIFSILGISDSKLDINEYSRKFFRHSGAVSDLSVDGNANVSDKSVCSYEYEYPKAIQKLNGIYLIWKKMVDDPKYGIKRANRVLDHIVSGALKIHDLHHIVMPYCYAYDSDCIVQKGLPYINNIKITSPKHILSYINLHIQFIAYASNQTAGAVGLPSFFIYLDYFCRKEWGEDYIVSHSTELSQHLQSFIYSCNYPFRGSQSSFVNISIFDSYFLKHLFGNTYYPDMSQPNFESIMNLQKFYARLFVHMSIEQPFTFPVNTANFYRPDDTKEIQDEEFLKFVSDLNCHNGCFNIYSGPLSALSSCCLSGDSVIKVINNLTGIEEIWNIKDFITKFTESKDKEFIGKIDTNYSVLSHNYKTDYDELKKITGLVKKQTVKQNLVKIQIDEREIVVTPDHMFKVLDSRDNLIKDVTAADILKDFQFYSIGTEE